MAGGHGCPGRPPTATAATRPSAIPAAAGRAQTGRLRRVPLIRSRSRG